MPRRPRIHIDGVPPHIVQRGHNRGACFFDDQDRHAYLGWLREALRRERCQLHAYVLMTNHVHLLLTPEHATSVPRLIISVGRRYVQYINHTHGRTLRRQTSVGPGWGSTSATGFRGFAVRCCLQSWSHAFGSYKGTVLPGEGSRGNCGWGSKKWPCRVCRRSHELAIALVGIEGGEGGGELVWGATEERNVIRAVRHRP
jgi:REP element-mobilizing transposase RayT